VTPKIKDTSRNLWYTYFSLTFIEALLLKLAGMSWFDSMTHSFATMATGGFSTKNASIAHFQSPAIEWIIIVFMFLAGANFGLYYLLSKGQWRSVLKDAELRFYGTATLVISAFIALMLLLGSGYKLEEEDFKALKQEGIATEILTLLKGLQDQNYDSKEKFLEALEGAIGQEYAPQLKEKILGHANTGYGFHHAIRSSLFQVIALITTTGFASDDYEAYPISTHIVIFFLLFCGGCAGSTAGGIKLFRILLIGKTIIHELQMSFRPALVSKIRVGNTIISNDLIRTVLAL